MLIIFQFSFLYQNQILIIFLLSKFDLPIKFLIENIEFWIEIKYFVQWNYKIIILIISWFCKILDFSCSYKYRNIIPYLILRYQHRKKLLICNKYPNIKRLPESWVRPPCLKQNFSRNNLNLKILSGNLTITQHQEH